MKRLPAEQQNQAPGSLRPPGARAASLTRGPRGLPARPQSGDVTAHSPQQRARPTAGPGARQRPTLPVFFLSVVLVPSTCIS